MPTALQYTRRLLFPLAGALVVAACEQVSAPKAAPRPTANAATLAAGHTPGMITFTARADFAAAADAAPIACTPAGSYTISADRYLGTGPVSALGLSTTRVLFNSCAFGFLQPEGDEQLAWTATGTIAMAGATRDTVLGTFQMRQYVSGNFGVDMEFTGGTGRFVNAAGTAVGTGSIDRTTLVGQWALKGSITRPNF